MRRHVAADLEHQLVALAQQKPSRITDHEPAVAVEADAAAKANQTLSPSGRPQTRNTSPSRRMPAKRTTPLGSVVQIGARQRAATTRPKRSFAPPRPIPAGTITTRRRANSSR